MPYPALAIDDTYRAPLSDLEIDNTHFDLGVANTRSSAGFEADTRPPLLGDVVFADLVRLPIHVRVERAPRGYFTAEDSRTGIFGQGATYDGAIADLRDALHQHRDVLALENELSAGLAEHLKILVRYLDGI